MFVDRRVSLQNCLQKNWTSLIQQKLRGLMYELWIITMQDVSRIDFIGRAGQCAGLGILKWESCIFRTPTPKKLHFQDSGRASKKHVIKLSALFRCNEPKTKSSVRYRRSCLQAEVRSYLYAICHCVVLKINEWNTFAWTLLLVEFDWYHIFAALCQNLGSEFGIGLLLCVYVRGKYRKFWSKRITMSCVLDYSVAMKSSPTT